MTRRTMVAAACIAAFGFAVPALAGPDTQPVTPAAKAPAHQHTHAKDKKAHAPKHAKVSKHAKRHGRRHQKQSPARAA